MENFNIQEYLDSGVIEMYVLDQLNDAEREAVEKLAAQYPEIRKEIAEVEEAMGSYHTQEGLTPPDHILSNILEATAKMATAPLAKNSAPSLPKRSVASLWTLIIAAIGLALAAWMFIGKQRAQQQAQQLQQEVWALRSQEQACAEREAFVTQQLNILRQDGLEKAIVKAGEQPIAAVYWDKSKQNAYLDLVNLRDPGPDKQYQLWAFVDGKPVSVGVIDWEDWQKGLVTFNFKNKPEAFAISEENYGGSPVPTRVRGASAPLQG